jgi:HAD superfamily hydrolase (TIGR01459 family)
MTRHSSPRGASIPLVDGIAPLAAGSDAWICDIWGVLHNGATAFAEAAAAGCRFRAEGGTVVLLSNAPRPADSVAAQLDGFGVPRDAYDAIVTSGDLVRGMLAEGPRTRLYHIGPERDRTVFAGLGATFAGPDDAERIICTGLWNDDVETPEDYRKLLTGLAARKLPMVCGNPDLVVERGHTLVYCAGALADLYEQLGGSVVHVGKPHAPAYEAALATISRVRGRPVDRTRVLAIGDGLRTDMAGAAGAGLRAVFIASALHVKGPLNQPTLDALFEGHPARPVAAMTALRW